MEELRSVSPFDIQPGQKRFTKMLVDSVNIENQQPNLDDSGVEKQAAQVETNQTANFGDGPKATLDNK